MDKFVIKTKSKNNEDSPGSENCAGNRTVPVTNVDPGTSSSKLNEESTSEKRLGTTAKKPKRRFNPDWNKTFPWIIYDQVKDVILCSVCKKIFEAKAFRCSAKREMTFIETGFCNWKKGTEKLKVHELSTCHREAIMKLNSVTARVNVSTQISDQKERQMAENRACLLKLFSSLLYLSTQGLAIRGHTDNESNYNNLLKVRCEDSAELRMWFGRESYTWCSHEIQNEMLDIMSHALLRKLIAEVNDSVHFAIICDETADVSRKEQFSFCLRFVTDSLQVEELFFWIL